MSKEASKHWFLMSFMIQQPGVWAPFSTVVGSEELNLTIPQLNAMKKAYQVPEASVMLSISYLGYMTEKKINGLPDVDPPTQISDFYRQGMVAATRVLESDPAQPLNPYGVHDASAEEMAKAREWQDGFNAVRTAQADKSTPVPQLELAGKPEVPQGTTVSGETKPENLRKPVKPEGKP